MGSVLKFEPGLNALIVAPTKSGKTTFVYKVLLNLEGMFQEPPKKIYYCYGVYQDLFDEMKNQLGEKIEFVNHCPDKNTLEKWHNEEPEAKFLIFDDMLQTLSQDPLVSEIFCKYSHHKNLIF